MTDTAGSSDDKQQSRAQLSILAEVSRGLNLIENPDELCAYLCRQVKAIIGKGYVLVSRIDETGQQFTLKAMEGFGDEKLVKAAIKAFGADPRGLSFAVKDMTREELKTFHSGRLELINGGIYALATRKFSRAACAAAQRVLGVKYTYVIGFMHYERHLGGVTILTASQKTVEANRDLIEAIMGQASVVLNRMLAETVLQDSESRLRSIYESTNIGLAFGDLNGKFLDINPALHNILGYTLEEIQRLGIPNISHPDDMSADAAHFMELIDGKYDRYQIEKRFYHKDGHIVWANTGVSMVRDGAGNPLYCFAVLEDITERKRTEEALRKNAAILSKAQDIGHMGSWEWDIATNETIWSEEVYRLYGLNPKKDHPNYNVVINTLAPECRDKFVKAIEDTLKYNKPFDGEYTIIRPDGTRKHTHTKGEVLRDKEGNPTLMLGMVQDITERKRAEEALRASEEHFRRTFDQSPIGIAIAGLDFRFTHTNQTMCRMLGYSEKEMTSLTFKDITHPDDLSRDVEEIQRLKAGEIERYEREKRYVRKDGTVFWGHLSVGVIKDETGQPLYFTPLIQDITERKLAEEALAEEIERRKGLFEQTPVGIVIHDPNTMRFLEFNRAAHEQLGYSREEFSRLSIPDVEAIETAEEARTRNGTLEHTGKMDFETRHRTRQGEIRDIHVTAQIINIAGQPVYQSIWQDITERKRAEETLRQSEKHFRTLFEKAADGIIYMSPETNIVEANESFAKMHGYTTEEIRRMKIQDLDVDDLSKLNPERMRRIQNGEDLRFDVRHRHKDGHIIDLEVSASLIQSETGPLYISFHRDITERKRAEELFRENMARLDLALQSARMGVWHWDIIENRRYFDIEACHLLGINPATFSGTAEEFFGAVHPDDRQTTKEALARTIEQNVLYEPEYRAVWPDGSIHYLAARGRLVRDDKGRPMRINGIIWDITQRKTAELALKESEQSYRSLFDNMLHGVAQCRMIYEDGEPVDFVYLSVNPAFETLTGLKQVQGKKVSEVIPGIRQTNPELFTIYNRVASTGTPESFEDYIQPLDIWLYLSVHSPQQGEFVTMFENITKRKRAEAEILRLNQLYAVISQVNQAVVHSSNQKQFLEKVCDVITEYGGFKLAWVGQIDHESKRVLPIASAGAARGFTHNLVVYTDERPEGRGPTGMCIRELKPVVQNDSINDPNTQPWYERAKTFGFRSSAAFPILMEGQIWGTLSVYSDTVGYFGPREKALLEEATADIGFALVNFNKEKLRMWAEEELRNSAAALQLSEERFRSIYENSTIGIYRTTPDGHILLANPSLLDLLGYSSFDELASKKLEEDMFDPSSPRSHFLELIEKDGEIRGIEIVWKRKDGSVIFVRESARAIRDAYGKTLYYDGMVEDITEHKRVEEALAESEEKFRNLAEQSPQIIFINIGGRIAYTNNRAVDIMGYSLEELYAPGFDFTRLSAPEYAADMKASFKKHMGGEEVPPLEYVLLTKAGKRIDAILNTRLIEYGGERAILGTITDISERKKAEEERRRFEEKAQVANRLAAVGEMAAGIAHEINNPLTGMIGFSELLLERDLPPEAMEEVKIIAEGSRRVADIVKRLLTFARQNKPVRTALNINALIENTLKLRTYVLQTANVSIHTFYDQTLPWITADPGQLQQVFLNLIINAEQAMKSAHNGGKLKITTAKRDNRIRIVFEDDGPGITKENMARLFQPFFTTKGPSEGTGLGLSLSRSIVLEHGGEMWAESQPGHGATFVVELPLFEVPTPPVDSETVRSTESLKHTPKARILVVDDESSVREYLQVTLTAAGHTVDCTGDPEEVSELINKRNYDIIFLDIRMPGMSGTELYGRILQKSPALARKVIFITGDTADAGIRAFLTRNNLPFLAKPFEVKAMESKIRACLEAD